MICPFPFLHLSFVCLSRDTRNKDTSDKDLSGGKVRAEGHFQHSQSTTWPCSVQSGLFSLVSKVIADNNCKMLTTVKQGSNCYRKYIYPKWGNSGAVLDFFQKEKSNWDTQRRPSSTLINASFVQTLLKSENILLNRVTMQTQTHALL